MINATQARMGRAALNWTTKDLSEKAGIGINTVTRFERGDDARVSTAEKIKQALEQAGVEFIPENGGGSGVRLRKGANPE